MGCGGPRLSAVINVLVCLSKADTIHHSACRGESRNRKGNGEGHEGECMSIIKSFSVGNGDMFYIKHNCDSFTMIDCCMCDDDEAEIVKELKSESAQKNVTRFISTHP